MDVVIPKQHYRHTQKACAPFLIRVEEPLAPGPGTRDCYSMANSADQLYSKHHGEVLRLHQLSRAELRAKRRAEWKQSQLTNTSNGQQQKTPNRTS